MEVWKLFKDGVQIGDSSSTGALDVPKNSGTTPVTYTVEYTDNAGNVSIGTYTVQTGSTCVDCDAGVSVNTNVDGDSTEHTTDAIGSYVVDSSRISYSGGLGWAIALFNNNEIKIKFYENTGNARSGDVIITLDGETCKTIHVSQEAKPTPACTCNDFSASTNSLSFGAEAGSSTVRFSKTGTCTGNLTSLTPSTNDSWITPTFNSSHDTLTIAVDTYSDYKTNRTGHTVVSYGDCDVVNIEVVQEKATPGACTCNNLYVDTTAVSFGSGADRTTRSCYKTGTCTGEINQPSVTINGGGDWCTASHNGDTITISVKEYSSGSGDRTATVTPKINNSSCSSKAITVTQTPPAAKCYDITPTSGNVSGNCTGGTVGFTATEKSCS